ncbi:MAG: hypothetical protein H6722_27030 [Sandaracinus sp.]|nr:hypothetical protein [Sandaracinus sp.]
MTTTVTKELIEAGRSDAGGWTREQLALIGVSWPPPKDWKRAAIGKQITEGSASRFIAIRSERPWISKALEALDEGTVEEIRLSDHADRNAVSRAIFRAKEMPRHLECFVFEFDGSRVFGDDDVRYIKRRVQTAPERWFYQHMFDDPWFLSTEGVVSLLAGEINMTGDMDFAEACGLVKGIRIDAMLGRHGFDLSMLKHVPNRRRAGRTKKPPLCAHDALPTDGEVARARRLRASGQGSSA